MKDFDVILLVNGAGELSALVRPTVYKLAEKIPQARIIIIITPCQYATGREYDIAKEIEGVDHIIRPWEYLKWLLFRIMPKGLEFNKRGIVVFMGGDLIHGKFISKRLKFPAIAYTEGNSFYKSYKNLYKEFLVPDKRIFDKLIKRGVGPEKVKIIGNLMVDSVKTHLHNMDKAAIAKKWQIDPDRKMISFLPGSRIFQIKSTLLYYIEVAKLIKQKHADIQIALILSPYMTMKILKKTVKHISKDIKLSEKQDGLTYLLKDGVEFLIIDHSQHDFINASTLAVTIPGTNTAEIAVIGTPMLVFFPFDRIDMIPFEGIFGWICSLPVIGFYLKIIYGKILDRYTKFFALPNKKAGKEVTPELRGFFTPEKIADNIIILLEDIVKLSRISAELKPAMGAPGASDRVIEEIIRMVEA